MSSNPTKKTITKRFEIVIYEIKHRTTYVYDEAVAISHHQARLTPREGATQRCLEHEVTIDPNPAEQSKHVDYFGNETLFFAMRVPHRQLTVTALSKVEVLPGKKVDAAMSESWEKVVEWSKLDTLTEDVMAGEFGFASSLVSPSTEFETYARQSFHPGRPVLEAALDLNARIFQDFVFDPTATDVATPVEEAFRKRRGVCQDFAHVLIACLRSMGLSAKYVSGYLETIPPPGQPKLVGADASHAWASVWCGSMLGWVDLDPTNHCIPGTRHITIASGRDFSDVSPLRGIVIGEGGQELTVAVDVTPQTARWNETQRVDVLVEVNINRFAKFYFGFYLVLGCFSCAINSLSAQPPLEKIYLKQKLADQTTAPASANHEYRLMLPNGLETSTTGATRKWPLLIYMHGGGSKGTDGLKPIGEALPKLLASPQLREMFACLVLVPQCRGGDDVSGERPNNWVKWNHQREKPELWTLSDDEPSDQLLGAMAALQDVLKKYPVDESRIYLTGVSMGGSASWNWASHDPQRFAAMIPVCGLSDVRRAITMSMMPVWTFHGSEDDQVPVQRTRDMVKTLSDAGSKVQYTEYKGGGHGIAKRVWTEDDHAALRWLFDQRKVDR